MDEHQFGLMLAGRTGELIGYANAIGFPAILAAILIPILSVLPLEACLKRSVIVLTAWLAIVWAWSFAHHGPDAIAYQPLLLAVIFLVNTVTVLILASLSWGLRRVVRGR